MALQVTKDNYQTAVVASERPVLLDFWATWCGPCKMIAPILEQVAQARPDITVGKINVDEEGELAAQFGVMSIPTLVVMKGGEVVSVESGARPKSQILAMLEG